MARGLGSRARRRRARHPPTLPQKTDFTPAKWIPQPRSHSRLSRDRRRYARILTNECGWIYAARDVEHAVPAAAALTYVLRSFAARKEAEDPSMKTLAIALADLAK